MILCMYKANTKKQRKQQTRKDQKSCQGTQRHQGNISCKHGHNHGQNWHEPSRSRKWMKCWQEYKRRTVSKKGLNHLLLLLLSCFSRARLFATPWTVPYQAPLSMGFSRHKYWSGVPLPSPLNHLDNHNGVITHIEQTTWDVKSSGSQEKLPQC